MDPMHEGVLAEFLEILRRAADEENDRGTKSRILQTLPLTNPEFEASALREALSAQLEARLGEVVDEAVASKDLEFAGDGCIEASAVEEAVARLAASQTFDRLVDEARAALERAGGPLLAATASSSAAVVPTSTVDDTGRDERGFLRRNGLSGSDTDAEGMHAKKVARRDDWVDIFGAGVGGGGSGVRVDIEGALHQLEDGLGDPGSVTASVEALGILAEVRERCVYRWARGLCLCRRNYAQWSVVYAYHLWYDGMMCTLHDPAASWGMTDAWGTGREREERRWKNEEPFPNNLVFVLCPLLAASCVRTSISAICKFRCLRSRPWIRGLTRRFGVPSGRNCGSTVRKAPHVLYTEHTLEVREEVRE